MLLQCLAVAANILSVYGHGLLGETRMLKTLIVEDSAIFRKTFRDALCRLFPSMLVQEAQDGTEALKKVKTFLPQLVFMDIKLQGESGLDLTKRIKASYPEIVVVILTHYDLPEYREAAREGGADDFIPKGSLSLADISSLVKAIVPGEGVG